MNFNPVPSRVHSHSIIDVGPQDRVRIGTEFYSLGRKERTSYEFQNEESGATVVLSHAEFYEQLSSDNAAIHYAYHEPEMQRLRLLYGDRLLSDFKDSAQFKALRYYKLIERFEREVADRKANRKKRLGRSRNGEFQRLLKVWDEEVLEELTAAEPSSRCDVAVEIKKFAAPSVKTFNKFYAQFQRCGRELIALAPRHFGPGARLAGRNMTNEQVESEQIAIEYANKFCSRLKPTAIALYREYHGKIDQLNEERTAKGQSLLKRICEKKFRKMIDDIDEYYKVATREGEAVALRRFQMIDKNFNVMVPGHRVEMDEWKVDLVTALRAMGVWSRLSAQAKRELQVMRLWLTLAIDVATRYVVAFRLAEQVNTATTLSTVRMIMSDKTHLSEAAGAKTPWCGRVFPHAIFTDNGTALSNETVDRTLINAGIGVSRPPAGQPQRRPFIERFFRTLGLLICHYFDGRTFGSIAEKGDYNPVANVTLTRRELLNILIIAICDGYHNMPHSGLGGQTPHNRWVEAVQSMPVRAVLSKEQMINVFGIRHQRTITKAGILFYGIHYNSPLLNDLFRQVGNTPVEVKLDPYNLHSVSVKGPQGWFLVPNRLDLDDTVNIEEWSEAYRQLVRENRASSADAARLMRQTILRLRKMGEEATARAGLPLQTITMRQLKKLEYDVIKGWRCPQPLDAGLPEELANSEVVAEAADTQVAHAEPIMTDETEIQSEDHPASAFDFGFDVEE